MNITININKFNEPIVQSALVFSVSEYFVDLLETKVPKDKQEEVIEIVRNILEEHSSVLDSNGG